MVQVLCSDILSVGEHWYIPLHPVRGIYSKSKMTLDAVLCHATDLKTARKQALIGGNDEHLPHGN